MTTPRMTSRQRRTSLLDAAETLFADRGFTATRLEDVAGRSGVSKQLLQRHFRTKAELLVAVLARHRDGLLTTTAAGGEGEGEGEQDRFRRRALAWFGYLRQNPNAARLLFVDRTGDPTVAAFYASMREDARAAVEQMIRADDVAVPDDLVPALAELVRSGMVGLLTWHAENPGRTDEQLVDLAVDLWSGRLRSDQDRGRGTTSPGPPCA